MKVCVLAYKRNEYKRPCFKINTNKKPAVSVKFCPKIFKKDPKRKVSLFDVPYNMVFAIATIDSVLVYQTQMLTPMYIVGNIHYAMLSDISWAGKHTLGISSNDGFCSFVVFAGDELGEELEDEKLEVLNLKRVIVFRNFYEEKKESLMRNNKQVVENNS